MKLNRACITLALANIAALCSISLVANQAQAQRATDATAPNTVTAQDRHTSAQRAASGNVSDFWDPYYIHVTCITTQSETSVDSTITTAGEIEKLIKVSPPASEQYAIAKDIETHNQAFRLGNHGAYLILSCYKSPSLPYACYASQTQSEIASAGGDRQSVCPNIIGD